MTLPRFMTERRMQVLEQVVQGATAAEIAKDMGVSERTVESHLEVLRELTGAANSRRLAYMALKKGWVKVEPEAPLTYAGGVQEPVQAAA